MLIPTAAVHYLGPADVHWSPRHKHHNEWGGARDGTANGLEQIQLLSGQREDSAVMTLTGGDSNINLRAWS